MVEEIQQGQVFPQVLFSNQVLEAMSNVPRHKFAPEQYAERAYSGYPIPIDYAQAMSSPFIVAFMTQLLDIKLGDKVLEIGTGSGYHAAVVAELTDKVYTVEIIEPLAEKARKRLNELGYTKVQTKTADGYFGWAEHAPYDAILVTAAPDHVPQPLIQQLKDGGRLVIPVGPPGAYQTLWLIEKRGREILRKSQGDVSFVPFTRGSSAPR